MKLVADRYELLDVIATGGMATVWRARDIRLDRLVAVKRPHPASSGDDLAERLNREARAAASLNHPNLITIYDYGTDGSGPYLVMELVDGPTLLEASQEDATGAIAIGAQLADALAAVHEAGIVHCDVKPGNVIMSNRGPLLTDFGIALDQDATLEITGVGEVAATPSYAAPEVLAGAEPSEASDVYSLGVTIDEMVRKSASTPIPEIQALLRRAMSAAPEDRPDAVSLASALRQDTARAAPSGRDDPTLVLTSPPRGEREDSDRRRPFWVWVAGLLVALAVAVAIAGFALSDTGSPADAASGPGPSSTSAVQTTTTSTVSTTSISTTSTLSLETSVEEVRSELETALLQSPRSDLNPPEVRDLMKKVDEAIEAAYEGDHEKARKKLSETAEKIEDKLSDGTSAEAMRLLERLADLLGVDLDNSGRADEDD